MKVINKLMEKVGEDKVLHFLVGIVIAVAFAAFAVIVKMNPGDSFNLLVAGVEGGIVGILVGVGKECWDYLEGEEFDAKDASFTGVGAIVGFLIILFMWIGLY